VLRTQIQDRETRGASSTSSACELRPVRASHAAYNRRHRTRARQGPVFGPEMPRQRPHEARVQHHSDGGVSQDVVPAREFHRGRVVAPPGFGSGGGSR